MSDYIRRQQRTMQAERERHNQRAADDEENRRRVREGEAAIREQERQEVNAVTGPFLARAEAEKQQRELEKERRIKAVEEARRAEGRAELEEHAQQQLNLWLVNGGTEESFRAAWPSMERDFMSGKQAERQKLIDEGNVF